MGQHDYILAAIAAVGPVLAAGGVWGYLAVRAKLRQSEPAAQTSADAQLLSAGGEFLQKFGEAGLALSQHLQSELDTMRQRFDSQVAALEAKVQECETHRDDCHEKMADLEKRLFLALNSAPGQPYLPGLAPRVSETRAP